MTIRVLTALLILGTLFPAQAQRVVPVEFEIEPVGPRKLIPQANFANRLAWAGISLINPDSSSRPIPLYGYYVSELATPEGSDRDSDSILSGILQEAAEGGVKLVMISPPAVGEENYVGQVLRILREGDTNGDENVLDAWRNFRENYELQDDSLIALSRPLSGDLADRPSREFEFMAGPGLWAPISPSSPARE